MMWADSLILQGQHVRLEPLTLAHVSALAEIGCDDCIWQYMRYGWIRSENDMRVWVENLLALQEKGTDVPFGVFHLATGRLAGVSRYLNICPQDRGLEIGGTWYGLEFQHTVVNTECKYLLLKHAFETLGAIRVQFKADSRNERSIRAIERIGAVREGLLRNHMILAEGVVRDSVYFSILDREWGGVKAKLEAFLRQG